MSNLKKAGASPMTAIAKISIFSTEGITWKADKASTFPMRAAQQPDSEAFNGSELFRGAAGILQSEAAPFTEPCKSC